MPLLARFLQNGNDLRPCHCEQAKVVLEEAAWHGGVSSGAGPGIYLAGSLDVEVVKPLQNCNSGHHPNCHVTEMAV